ncbi:hypothetical protein [Clostridium botulinum]|uniref:hypothetical protein n=1 Tax=Clostridium botulinum TaxID=1491 RepID=UPI001E5F933A|nr:hypothetical protein [Clostridium botulinum]MCD3254341.1 hypothetical protein [Clostridium botulinum C/D]MCD3279841.1 hypothetical protein [Clostridium botulinum C/D]MCD3339620.1 hypothetical protein [Clostridium botulinum C/D]MCD3357480.1 hypothetical protein [Clostridium botulinum C/D]
MDRYKEPKLFYTDKETNKKGAKVGGFIFNYIPPTPVLNVKENKPLLGYTTFQNNLKSDTKINFTLYFGFNEENEELREKQIQEFLKFRSSYNEWFYFEDEFNTLLKGRITKKFDIKIPEQFEGEIYYIDVELLCPHGLEGIKEELEPKEVISN